MKLGTYHLSAMRNMDCWTCHDMLLINLSLPPVHERDGHEGHEDHDGADADGGVLGGRLAQTSCDEQIGRVVEDCVDPSELPRVLLLRCIDWVERLAGKEEVERGPDPVDIFHFELRMS